MALTTKSVFYFGHVIDDTNFQLDFDEGAGEITAEFNVGSYSLTEFGVEIERALNAASLLPQEYTVTLDRVTRKYTITAPGAFSLLITTGTHVGTSVFTLMGFTGADRASLVSHESDSASGEEYLPQLELQDYVPTSRWKNPTSANVNVSSTGKTEAIRFGEIQFMSCNISWITNIDVSTIDWLDNNPTAVEDVIAFLEALTKKGTIEFMEDKDTRATFETMILDKTQESQNGVGYKLFEFVKTKKLPDWFETKTLTFRKLS